MSGRKPDYVRDLDRIFSDGAFTVTTSGHSAIVTNGAVEGAQAFPERMASLVSNALAFTGAPLDSPFRDGFFELPACSDCVGDEPRVCPQCHGGRIATHFCGDCGDEHECFCDRCGGDGTAACPICDRAFTVEINGAAFDLRLIVYTMRQMGGPPSTGGVMRESSGNVLVLRGDTATALVMHMVAGEDETRRALTLGATP